MPIGVVVEESKKFMLKSCPPDGFVVIRRMNYGESLKRKDMMASIAMEMQSKKSKNEAETTKLQMDLLQEKTSLWEFAQLVVEHNITDAKENLLNFRDPAHVKMLVGRIGDEIQMYINEMNSFEDDEEVGN